MSQLFESDGQSFSFNISPSNEHTGLISFRMDWLDLLVVQGSQESPPTGVVNGKPLRYSCLENPKNSIKRTVSSI